mmetsp:Transcript_67497/g.219855  ORF Transcript_67497/g.219855 Transcript_67497/m.219855 type:complete len:122 (+) Transcript_67497:174-539(+)
MAEAMRQNLIDDAESGVERKEGCCWRCLAASLCLALLLLVLRLDPGVGHALGLVLKPFVLLGDFVPRALLLPSAVIFVVGSIYFLCRRDWQLGLAGILLFLSFAAYIVMEDTILADGTVHQ